MKNLLYAWKLLKSVWFQMRVGELQLVANSLSFSTAMALVPFLALTISIVNELSGLEKLTPKVEKFLLTMFSDISGYEVIRVIKLSIRNVQSGTLGMVGVIVLVWTCMRLLHDMEIGINRIWHIRRKRNWFVRTAVSLLVVILLPIGLAAYVGIISWTGLSLINRLMPEFASDMIVAWFGLFVIFKFVPQAQVRTQLASISSGITALCIVGLKMSFKPLAIGLFNFGKIYGGVVALPLLLVWIMITWYIILGGVALCAGLHRS